MKTLGEPAGDNFQLEDRSFSSSALSNAARVVRDAILREFASQPEKFENKKNAEEGSSTSILDVLDALVENATTGKSLDKVAPDLTRLVHAQNTRADVIESVLGTLNFQRLAGFTRARSRVEDVILKAANEGKLTPSDALAFLEYLNKSIDTIQSDVKSRSSSNSNVNDIVERLKVVNEEGSAALKKKLAGTTTQNREIVRRLAHTILKASKKAEK